MALLGVIAAALIGHHTGTKQVAAAVDQAKAAARQADASAKQAMTADWVAYSQRIERELGRQDREIVELKTSFAESEERSKINAGRYRTAVQYIREIADWVASKWPGEKLPDAPADLAEDLEHP
ncbi:Uncharacterised protein [Mycobacteroides abscessus subsp. abscessus]|nr:Uncharacterised protein [Mycobacteroides abscessus subsp. abscessus]SKU57406.1 Uncharacterised protein [Mycobacteroides abscessus subsp. abscessus]